MFIDEEAKGTYNSSDVYGNAVYEGNLREMRHEEITGAIIMSAIVKRGYSPNDQKEFNSSSMEILCNARRDLYYLLNQGYHIKGASTFVGNHYLLSERQRSALARAVSSKKKHQNKKIQGNND